MAVEPDFLQKNPSEWSENDSFKTVKQFVRTVKITNDTAERGCHMITEYNAVLTKNEMQKQFMLQGVEEHRKTFTDCNKNTLKKKIWINKMLVLKFTSAVYVT